MSQTRIMSIHRLLMRLFPAFCLGKALNGNVKHFVFDLTCDVTGDLEVKFLNFIWKISSRPFHCRLNFFPTSVGFRDRWGGRYGPPPPAEGRVRTRPSRARVKRLPENINIFVNACPDVDFFATSVHWKSQVLRFCEEQGTYIGWLAGMSDVYMY